MAARKWLPMLPVLAAALTVAGCSIFGWDDEHYVDVYVNDDCRIVTLENDTAIKTLLVFPGDKIVFNNLTAQEVEIALPEGYFEKDAATIVAGGRVMLKVIRKEPSGTSMTVSIKTICDDGTPKVQVGDDP